jgi:tryptophanyl-tRNA synthetase
MRKAYAGGIGWGDAKQKLFERIDYELAPLRERYEALIAAPAKIEDALLAGAKRARALSRPFVERLRHAVGLRSLRSGIGAAAETKSERAEKPALQPVVFREADAFAFKVLDAKRDVLATQGGFADPKAAMAAARVAMEALAGS